MTSILNLLQTNRVGTKKKVGIDRARARREFLALRPARNPSITWEEIDGLAMLTIPRPDNWKVRAINRFLPVPVPETRQVQLDAIGSFVWRGSDGKSNIEKLSRDLQREYKLGAREAELSLQQFFKDLGRRGYIGFINDNPPDYLKAKSPKPR